jgi:hypothetical protein
MPLPGQALSSRERAALAARIRHHSSLHAGLRNKARICKHLRSSGIDSEESILPAYEAWRAGTTNRVFVPARQARNRFLGSLKHLQIRALHLDSYTRALLVSKDRRHLFVTS